MMSTTSHTGCNYFENDHSTSGHLCEQNTCESKHGIWKCSVCTYENDNSLSSCNICGVFRGLFKGVENKALGIHKNSTSVMAKALFMEKPLGTAERPCLSVVFLRKDAESFELRSKASFSNHHNRFRASNSKHSFTIVPFRFDTLSPDDIVSQGKSTTRMKPKDKLLTRIPAGALPSSITEKEVARLLPSDELESSSSQSSSHLNESQSNKSSINVDESEILISNLHRLKLDKRIKNKKQVMCPAQYKPEKWMLSGQGQETLNQFNIVIVGHVDSGKSTLCGRLLHLLGRISKKEMHKYQKEAKEKGKGSFAYAWAMDESAEERERGITMTVALAYFETKKYHVVLLDSPGHKDFVPNMISGAAQADAAILVVDVSNGSFESGMGVYDIGQTKEHAQLIRSFGVEQIIVALNKMDTVEYSKKRFDYVKSQLAAFLRTCGFKETQIAWIPLSVMDNQNLVEPTSDVRFAWYHGLCLLDAIDSLYPPQRDILKPLLLPICDVVSSYSLGHIAACGKLEAGAIRNGSKVLVMPSGDLATVRSIERDFQAYAYARAGDQVAVSLQGIDGANLVPGGVLCHPDFPVTVASILELKILVLDIKMPILSGSPVEFYTHHAKEAAHVAKIVSLIDQKKGKTTKSTPRLLMARQSAIIEVTLDRPICVEEFSSCRALGRGFLRASGSTIAVGIVTRIIAQDEQ